MNMGLITTLICYALLIAMFLLLCAFLTYSAYIYYMHGLYSHIHGPKRTSFFTGNLRKLVDNFDKGKQVPVQILEWQQEYGLVYHVFVFHRPKVYVLDSGFVKTLLLNNDHLKTHLYTKFHYVYGSRMVEAGLVSQIDHSAWMKNRRIMNPAFNRKYLSALTDQFNYSTDILINKLVKMADGTSVINMLNELNRYTLHAIGSVAFGMNLDVITNPESTINTDVIKCLQGIQRQIVKPLDWISPLKATRNFRESVRQAIHDVRKLGESCIQDRVNILKNGNETPPKDMLTCILQMFNDENGDELNIDDMVDQFITFFIAGQETTSNLLGFTIMVLATNPEILHRLRTEVNAVVGDKETVEYEDVCKMEYCTLVLKETLRLFPPAHSTWRSTAYELECCGYKIPAHTDIMVSTYVMGRMEEYFDNPLEFDPTRFKDAEGRHTYTYLPFSLGARNCIGQQFAMIESRIFLAKFVRNFNFELIQGHTFDVLAEITMKPKDPCKGYLSRVQ